MKTRIFIVLSIVLCVVSYTYFFFWGTKRSLSFSNGRELLAEAPKLGSPLDCATSLIPQDAKNINIYYRINRPKDIVLTFELADENTNIYKQNFVDSAFEHGYVPIIKNLSPQKSNPIYFRGNANTFFGYLTLVIEGKKLCIETFK